MVNFRVPKLLVVGFFTILFLTAASRPSSAETHCTMIVDYKTSEVLFEDGDCETRQSPQSTFKVALALMGFDSGALKDAHAPVLPYKSSYDTNREEERHATDPARWLKDSVVWYSQALTTKLGIDQFQQYVDAFSYGNRDLRGDKGKENGLTHAWLSSSLLISPLEQTQFISAMLSHRLGLRRLAYDTTTAIVPQFAAGPWTVHGKTGSGFHRRADGKLDRNRQEGWFIGWAVNGNRIVTFATFIADGRKTEGYAGPRARDSLLAKLPALVGGTEIFKNQ